MRARQLIDQLTEVAYVEPLTGELNIDYSKPHHRGYFGTKIRRDDAGKPTLYKRQRQIPGTDKRLDMYYAYTRNNSGTDVLHAIKAMDKPMIANFVRRTAIYVAAALQREHRDILAFDAVVPAPSSSQLSKTFAKELADRLQVPMLDSPQKVKPQRKIGVQQRMAAAQHNFQVTDQPRLNGNILVVDDYSTSGGTLMGLAMNLYKLPDVEYVAGVAIATI